MVFSVECGGRRWDCDLRWGGTLRPGRVALDWETTVDDLSRVVPVGVLATVCDGRRAAVVHPDQIPALVREVHASGSSLVMQNAAFDLWVTEAALLDACDDAGVRLLRELIAAGRVWDVMLLDRLALLALGDGVARNRPLDQIARAWLDPAWKVDKADPYRMRYGELLGKDLLSPAVEPGFFSYAVKDAIVTAGLGAVVVPAVERLVAERGWPCEARWGPLSHHVVLRSSWALAQVTRNGFGVDAGRLSEWQDRMWEQLEDALARLQAEVPGVVKTWVRGPKDGSARAGDRKLSASGTPALSDALLRERLEVLAVENEWPTWRTESGLLSLAESHWEEYRAHPLVGALLEFESAAKIYAWTKQLDTSTESVHPRYDGPKMTGRTSAFKPSIQNTPKQGTFRHMFAARPGYALLIADYAAVEMVTLASVLQHLYGESVLGDVLRAGRDPHAYTASLVLGVGYEEFLGWEATDKAAYKKHRQAAKAINFGVPGGLGAVNLAAYARATYGVDLSAEEAGELRRRLVRDVYPELGRYLDDDPWGPLAAGLNRTAEECRAVLGGEAFTPAVVRRILTGRGRAAGGDYHPDLEDRVWRGLSLLLRGRGYETDLADALGLRRVGYRRLRDALDRREPDEQLERSAFRRDAVLRTGRARGYCFYTESKNTPFQGLAADGATTAVYRLVAAGERVVAFVHDEVVVEIPAGEDGTVACEHVDKVCDTMIESMQEVVGFGLPVKVEAAVASCWSKSARLLTEGSRVRVWTPEGS